MDTSDIDTHSDGGWCNVDILRDVTSVWNLVKGIDWEILAAILTAASLVLFAIVVGLTVVSPLGR